MSIINEILKKVGSLQNFTEVILANEYGLDSVIDYRKQKSTQLVKELRKKENLKRKLVI